ncbi:MAG: hypothetical protein IPM68_09635 [Flavobacteriales bacterium]|nr:hypothetical protein [Flavobacteriales bacterium]
MSELEPLPWSRTARVLAVLSLPLSLLAQLVVPALLMAACALVLALRARARAVALPHRFGPKCERHARTTIRLAAAGAALSLVLWALYAASVLP